MIKSETSRVSLLEPVRSPLVPLVFPSHRSSSSKSNAHPRMTADCHVVRVYSMEGRLKTRAVRNNQGWAVCSRISSDMEPGTDLDEEIWKSSTLMLTGVDKSDNLPFYALFCLEVEV